MCRWADYAGAGEPPPRSGGNEGKTNLTARVVAVRVHEHDALPHPERRRAVDQRNDDARRDECRKDVVGSVTGRSMAVHVHIISRQ